VFSVNRLKFLKQEISEVTRDKGKTTKLKKDHLETTERDRLPKLISITDSGED